jgi:hypothetical protein
MFPLECLPLKECMLASGGRSGTSILPVLNHQGLRWMHVVLEMALLMERKRLANTM